MDWIRIFAGQWLRLGSEDGAGQKAGAEKTREGALEHVSLAQLFAVLVLVS